MMRTAACSLVSAASAVKLMNRSVLAVGLVVAVTGYFRDFAEDMAPPPACADEVVYSLNALASAMRLKVGTTFLFLAGFSRPYWLIDLAEFVYCFLMFLFTC